MIYKEILDKFGIESQLNQATEELAELIVAINKYRRYQHLDQVIEEMIDVEIMLEQLKFYVEQCNKIDLYNKRKSEKIINLLKLL
jgi:NTP pyrophosphatase (non-canonical NTP hydrolase)